LPLTTPRFWNFSNLGEGATADLGFLAAGPAGDLVAGFGGATAFLFRTGFSEGDLWGLVSVDACSLL